MNDKTQPSTRKDGFGTEGMGEKGDGKMGQAGSSRAGTGSTGGQPGPRKVGGAEGDEAASLGRQNEANKEGIRGQQD